MTEKLAVPDYIAFDYDADFGPTVQPGEGLRPLPIEELVITGRRMPIAETTALPPDFYDDCEWDTRYAADAERQVYYDKLVDFQKQHPEEVSARLLPLFRTCLFEPRFLASYFDSPDASKEEPENIKKFFGYYDVASYKEVRDIRAVYNRVPPPLRYFAREDIATAHNAMQYFASIPSVSELIDAGCVLEALPDLSEIKGADRMSLLRHKRAEVQEFVRNKLAEEMNITDDPQQQEKRIYRKRAPLDGVDAGSYRATINNGVVINPSYLFDPRYDRLALEPEASVASKRGFLRHMTNGEHRFGHSHLLLYRNNKEASTTHAGTPPDCNTSRPGNFLYHDLRMLETGPYKIDFPLESLHRYVLDHYLEQMDADVLGPDGKPENADAEGSASLLAPIAQHENTVIPLTRDPNHVIPFRALKRDFESDQYYEYGEECYLAELVDMALQFDKINEARGTADIEQYTRFGSVRIGPFAQDLVNTLRNRYPEDITTTATVLEQLLFMSGDKPAGGRKGLMDHLTMQREAEFFDFNVVEYVCDGTLQPQRPLTGAYNWFITHARPVSREELDARGVPFRPNLFGKAGEVDPRVTRSRDYILSLLHDNYARR